VSVSNRTCSLCASRQSGHRTGFYYLSPVEYGNTRRNATSVMLTFIFSIIYLLFFISKLNIFPQQWQPQVSYDKSRGPVPSSNRRGPISEISLHLEMGWKRMLKNTIFCQKTVFRGGRLTFYNLTWRPIPGGGPDVPQEYSKWQK